MGYRGRAAAWDASLSGWSAGLSASCSTSDPARCCRLLAGDGGGLQGLGPAVHRGGLGSSGLLAVSGSAWSVAGIWRELQKEFFLSLCISAFKTYKKMHETVLDKLVLLSF